MLAEIIFIIVSAAVLLAAVSIIKKYAPDFFRKIAKFVPIFVFIIGFIASAIFNKVHAGHFELPYAALYGYFVASAEVYTYEGICKLFLKIKDFFKKTKNDVESLKKDA